jgi:hypothetical protein
MLVAEEVAEQPLLVTTTEYAPDEEAEIDGVVAPVFQR